MRSLWCGLIFVFAGVAVSDPSLFSIDDDVFGDDAGSGFFFPESEQNPLTGEFSDLVAAADPVFDNLSANDLSLDDLSADYFSDDDLSTDNSFTSNLFADNTPANNLFADNLLADDQSCAQTPGRLRARGSSCSSSDHPQDRQYTPSDEKVLSVGEVEQYWCGSNPPKLSSHQTPVCSLQAGAGLIESLLRSYQRQSFTFFLFIDKLKPFVSVELCLVTGLNYLMCQNDKVYCCYDWRPFLPLNPRPLAVSSFLRVLYMTLSNWQLVDAAW